MPDILAIGNISAAYRKSHTRWQRPSGLRLGMAYREASRTAARRTWSLAPSPYMAIPTMGIKIYGCGQDEAKKWKNSSCRPTVLSPDTSVNRLLVPGLEQSAWN
jgi:hypothetical protein